MYLYPCKNVRYLDTYLYNLSVMVPYTVAKPSMRTHLSRMQRNTLGWKYRTTPCGQRIHKNVYTDWLCENKQVSTATRCFILRCEVCVRTDSSTYLQYFGPLIRRSYCSMDRFRWQPDVIVNVSKGDLD